MNKSLPAVVCGFAAGVLGIVPLVKNFSCCLIIPFAAVFSIILYQRSTKNFNRLKASTCIILGLLTGIFSAIFGTAFEVLIMFISKTSDLSTALPEMEKLLKEMPANPIYGEVMNILYKVSDDITNYGFSIIYTMSVLFSGLIINSIFGMIGGLIGMQVLNNRNKQQN